MIGEEQELPEGYKGLVFSRSTEGNVLSMEEMVKLRQIGKFSSVTEWRKDQWQDDHGYPKSTMDFL